MLSRRVSHRWWTLLGSVIVGLAFASIAPAGESYLNDGDYWLMTGDSITNIGTFQKLTARIINHFHPDAAIRIGNSAVNGVTADYEAKVSGTPTIVSIMLGMNDAIHKHHPFTPDVAAFAERYRATITQKVKGYQDAGADVVLLTPTYTDERLKTAFENAMTRQILEAYGKVVREVAAATGCTWVPVAEDFEAYQDTLGPNQFLRHDGVHPYGFGQYQIARTLWQHLNLRGDLSPERVVMREWRPADVHADLSKRFMHAPGDGVELLLSATVAHEATISWSLGDARGTEKRALGPEPTAWQPPIPEAALAMQPGDSQWLIVDVVDAQGCSVIVVDLARVAVLKAQEGVVSGRIESDQDRPEGKLVATWEIREREDELWFSGEVYDSEVTGEDYWPFSRDGIHLWLDLRPPERFGNPTVEAEVTNSLILAEVDPVVSITHVPWVNPQMGNAMVVGGSVLAEGRGYRWHLGLRHRLSTSRVIDIRKHDYYGLNLFVVDRDPDAKPPATVHYGFSPHVPDPASAIPNMTIIDRKGDLPATTTKLSLFGP